MLIKSQKNLIAEAQDIFKKYPMIKLVYFFGSRARNESGPMSDYDFAVYVDENKADKFFDLRLELLNKLGATAGQNQVDLLILNKIKSPELKYNIIKEGRLIYEKEPYRVLIEPKILSEYFDFHSLLVRYKLTKS